MSLATPDLDRLGPTPAGARLLSLPAPPVVDDDGRPPLRLLPAPASEPPYDDELPAPPAVLRAVPDRPARHAAPTAGATALASAPAGHGVVLRLVAPVTGDRPALADDDDPPAARTPLDQLPASRPFAHALVQRLLEVLAGLRPVSQLQRDTSFEVFTELEQQLAGRARPAGARPTRRDVRSVHVQEHEDGVAEVCATVRRGGRVTALALRLEGVSGAWRCTELLGV